MSSILFYLHCRMCQQQKLKQRLEVGVDINGALHVNCMLHGHIVTSKPGAMNTEGMKCDACGALGQHTH